MWGTFGIAFGETLVTYENNLRGKIETTNQIKNKMVEKKKKVQKIAENSGRKKFKKYERIK